MHVLYILAMLAALVAPALAHDPHDHPTLAGWAEEQLITPQTSHRIGGEIGICPDRSDVKNLNCKCCADSEILRDVQFRVTGAEMVEIEGKLFPKEEWWYKRDGDAEFKRVPDHTIHWGEHAPDGKPVLFVIGRNEPRCFFPPLEGG